MAEHLSATLGPELARSHRSRGGRRSKVLPDVALRDVGHRLHCTPDIRVHVRFGHGSRALAGGRCQVRVSRTEDVPRGPSPQIRIRSRQSTLSRSPLKVRLRGSHDIRVNTSLQVRSGSRQTTSLGSTLEVRSRRPGATQAHRLSDQRISQRCPAGRGGLPKEVLRCPGGVQTRRTAQVRLCRAGAAQACRPSQEWRCCRQPRQTSSLAHQRCPHIDSSGPQSALGIGSHGRDRTRARSGPQVRCSSPRDVLSPGLPDEPGPLAHQRLVLAGGLTDSLEGLLLERLGPDELRTGLGGSPLGGQTRQVVGVVPRGFGLLYLGGLKEVRHDQPFVPRK